MDGKGASRENFRFRENKRKGESAVVKLDLYPWVLAMPCLRSSVCDRIMQQAGWSATV